MLAQTAQVDSLIVSDTVDAVAVVEDSTSQVQMSDSVAVVLEQVKELTDKVSEQSAQLVKEVFSDSTVVSKYNQILDSMVAQYAAEVEGISAHDSVHVNPLYFRLFAPLT